MTSIDDLDKLDAGDNIEIDPSLLQDLQQNSDMNNEITEIKETEEVFKFEPEEPEYYQEEIPIQRHQPRRRKQRYVEPETDYETESDYDEDYIKPMKKKRSKKNKKQEDFTDLTQQSDWMTKGIYFLKFFAVIFISSTVMNSKTMLGIFENSFSFLLNEGEHSWISIFVRSMIVTILVIFFYYYVI